MTDNRLKDELSIFTIGHSNHELQKLIDLLKFNEIEVVADIRSNPHSRFASQFNKDDFKKAIQAAGIKYLFLGKEVGGKPEDPEFYDPDGFVLYSRIAKSPLFLEGIERLMNGIRNYRVVLMCSEENPAHCHRRLLVGRVLSEKVCKYITYVEMVGLSLNMRLLGKLIRSERIMVNKDFSISRRFQSGNLHNRFYKKERRRILRCPKNGRNQAPNRHKVE